MGLSVVTPEEKRLLQDMITEAVNQRFGSSSQGMPRRDRNSQSGPSSYIALTGSAGIPALDDTVDPNEPGQAVCAIYEIRDTGTSSELIDMKLEEVVYNLNTSELGEETWVTIIRDNYGKWIANVSSLGERIIFKITDVDPYCEWVEAYVLAGPCSGSPGIGDIVRVYDVGGCFFNVPPDELVSEYGNDGLIGYASKYKVDVDGYGTGADYTDCQWVVDGLCCGELV